MNTVILYRPIDSKEFTLIEASGWRQFTLPRLLAELILTPDEECAIRLAREWEVVRGAGFVTRFVAGAEFVSRYPVRTFGARTDGPRYLPTYEEIWVPREELAEFNRHIVGKIEVIHMFGKPTTVQ